MPAPDAVAFVRAALPPVPARVLEVGAGDGALAAVLDGAGYDVVAIDPESGGTGVWPVALHQLEAKDGSFDAAVAIVSLHHVQPLARSCKRLAEVLKPGAPLIVDEFDVERLDERAAEWWLTQRRALGSPREETPAEHVAMMREHIHPVSRLAEELAPWFDVGAPVPGPYLYRRHPRLGAAPSRGGADRRRRAARTGVRLVAVRR